MVVRNQARTADQRTKPAGRGASGRITLIWVRPKGTVRPLTDPEYQLNRQTSSYFSYRLTGHDRSIS
jgi:hypothetical protein